ncbi:MAG: chorismate mutase [Oscillospiraceae bacterium]|jgi:chorismate mutase/prephenate dehydratase|nr:chorismate mutase [Oscillospiraceae bacterium]
MTNPKEELAKLRERLDKVTADLTLAFNERQRISSEIAVVKANGNIAITDDAREQFVVDSSVALADADNKANTVTFVRGLIALSKIRQNEKLGLLNALEFAPPRARIDGKIAYQGIAGAWSEQAAHTLFPDSELTEREYFADVFDAVLDGGAAYGVVPLENSRAGAVGDVYDLLRRNAVYIVGQVWLDITQCLVGISGTQLSEVREVFSHEQGLSQCNRFLRNKNWELTAVSNTAVAAKMVADKDNRKLAAIASRRAAELFGLEVLAPDIADDKGNKTRFIVIAKNPEYDEHSDTVTVTFSTNHYSGALVSVLQAFMLAGINLKRIESRPGAVPNNYRFFVDMEDANILNPSTRDALIQAAMQCEYFEILGCYSTAEQNKI